MNGRAHIKKMVIAALMASLMIVGAYIKIPLGPVPIVLTNLFAVFSGILLGPVWGLISVGLYLLLGLIGLPVFSGGGGPGYFAGPTGGYLAGYLLGTAAAGLVSGIGTKKILWAGIGAAAGFAAVYALGIPWLKHVLDIPWSGAMTAGLVPFIIGDAAKAAVIIAVFATFQKKVPDLLPDRNA